jgi:hypothetical protein
MEPAALGSHDKDRRWTVHVSDQGGLLRTRGGDEERVRLRDDGSVSVPRLVVTILCCVLILVAVSVPSLITLAVLTVLLCGSAGYETATSREFRRELRAR